ncbi:hypothetical protein [Streptomyces sp. NPDC047718]|uniref:hypothetical protein n=1 Tax=Streptomyces sp. NPDC047718 TaxID=3155479 RepID=UPI0033FD2379
MHETTPASAPAPTSAPAAGSHSADGVLTWATTLAVALTPVAFFFGGLAQTAAEVHPRTVAVVTACWWASWTATPLLAVVFRLSRRTPTLARAGRWAGWIATLPPTLTILLSLGL